MGRRARTNCSPIDSALEKYHNDIGNRLSGVFVPPLPTSEEPTDFGMLTLDTRQRNSMRIKHKESPLATIKSTEAQTDAFTENTQQDNLSLDSSSSLANSDQDSINSKEKRGLVDKVTRALFQRKHTCSRCQRKSRSCMPNKNFNGTEKHYMCGNCRENSYAIKHLFSGPSTLSSPLTSTSSKLHQQQVRKQLNDSGYETVTSCSTVASAYSAFTNTTESGENKAPSAPAVRGDCDHMLGHTDSHLHEQSQSHHEHSPRHGPIVYSKPQLVQQEVVPPSYQDDESPGLQQFLAPGGILRQVNTKHTKDYDGYLPAAPFHHHPHHLVEEGRGIMVVRPPLSDTTNAHPQTSHNSSSKECFSCGSSSKPCFRLPWAGGWLCEDCMDGMC